LTSTLAIPDRTFRHQHPGTEEDLFERHLGGASVVYRQRVGLQITNTRVRISAWAYLKFVSSLTSPHYLWRSLGPFSLPCTQMWP
jgi:hypothetical protein